LELIEIIGQGGAGLVYRAKHLNLQREVAVKLLPRSSQDDAANEAWLRESRTMASLVHPGIVGVHDSGHVEGFNYLVMEYLVGGSLRGRMERNRPLSLDETVRILKPVVEAIQFMHSRGLLHLDLKPENILFTREGQIKIADFGLSTPQADGGYTTESHFQGTLDYAAPDSRCGQPLDARFDVFSLATVTYELLTGRLPGRVFIPPSRRNPSLTPSVDTALQRGLARDRGERFASVSDFLNALASNQRVASPLRRWALVASIALAFTVPLGIFLATPPKTETISKGTTGSVETVRERPERFWVFAERDDLIQETGQRLARESGLRWKPCRIVPNRNSIPAELPLIVPPTPAPAMVLRAPGGWGFVHWQGDPELPSLVLQHWSELADRTKQPRTNYVRFGNFEGDALTRTTREGRWRIGDNEPSRPGRNAEIAFPPGENSNPALQLTHFEKSEKKHLIGIYQPLAEFPPAGSICILRYRARSEKGVGSITVYAALPLEIEADDPSEEARSLWEATSEIEANRTARWYRCRTWLTPSTEWTTAHIIWKVPNFPSTDTHRNLVIDLAGADRVWVDDVELFSWQPGGRSE
jgi:serine/threonine protein kinase